VLSLCYERKCILLLATSAVAYRMSLMQDDRRRRTRGVPANNFQGSNSKFAVVDFFSLESVAKKPTDRPATCFNRLSKQETIRGRGFLGCQRNCKFCHVLILELRSGGLFLREAATEMKFCEHRECISDGVCHLLK
jgi:hypothetical protein